MAYKILILQAYESTYKKLADTSYLNKKYYADKHGYEFLSIEVSWANIKPAVWIIPTVIHNILCDINYKDFDYIFWTDVDSLIINFEIKLEDIIIKGKENNIIASMWNYNTTVSYANLKGDIDVSLKPSSWFLIHTGNWLIKNNEWSKKFFGIICADTRFSRKDLLNAPGGDEFAFTIYYLSQPQMRQYFSLLPTDTFVSLDGKFEIYTEFSKKMNLSLYKEGDFIVHYPYQPTEIKEKLMIPLEVARNKKRLEIE